jgi:predicted transcriptional regulator
MPREAEPLTAPHLRREAEPLAPPSKTDLEILAVLWDAPQATGKAIYEALLSKGVLHNDISYTTVKTYRDRLMLKGYVTARTLGDPRGTYMYTATVSRQEVCDYPALLERIINALQLRPPELVRWFHRKGKLSRKDKAELEVLLHSLPAEALPPQEEIGKG